MDGGGREGVGRVEGQGAAVASVVRSFPGGARFYLLAKMRSYYAKPLTDCTGGGAGERAVGRSVAAETSDDF